MLDYLNNYLSLHLKSLNEDLEQLSNKMESLDPNCKEFGELDFEYNFVSGQASATSHIISIIMEKEEENASNQ
jgi:hypothetical protein